MATNIKDAENTLLRAAIAAWAVTGMDHCKSLFMLTEALHDNPVMEAAVAAELKAMALGQSTMAAFMAGFDDVNGERMDALQDEGDDIADMLGEWYGV